MKYQGSALVSEQTNAKLVLEHSTREDETAQELLGEEGDENEDDRETTSEASAAKAPRIIIAVNTIRFMIEK
jgi:hypothetical protein